MATIVVAGQDGSLAGIGRRATRSDSSQPTEPRSSVRVLVETGHAGRRNGRLGRRDDDGERTATLGQQGRSAGTPLTPEDPPTIGAFELVSRLGSGGMGTVYLARAADGADVALKAIRRDFTADPVYRARFLEEVSNARKVASFCTARVLDHGEDAGRLFLVTEYIDGISLEDQLIEHGPLSPSMLHSMAVGVAAALTAIHAVGLVHRDLKPANVMLTLGGPRVIDFGLARSTHVSGGHTNAGMVMGTPGWIAPEQVF
ncbi:MAG: serine/threonine protein kinase, partial [Nonomuraea sp.]|nr:serine/threonine protein kinase [Nonomuraea sp.]